MPEGLGLGTEEGVRAERGRRRANANGAPLERDAPQKDLYVRSGLAARATTRFAATRFEAAARRLIAMRFEPARAAAARRPAMRARSMRFEAGLIACRFCAKATTGFVAVRRLVTVAAARLVAIARLVAEIAARTIP